MLILFAATDEFEAAEVNREGITKAEAASTYYGERKRGKIRSCTQPLGANLKIIILVSGGTKIILK